MDENEEKKDYPLRWVLYNNLWGVNEEMRRNEIKLKRKRDEKRVEKRCEKRYEKRGEEATGEGR